MNREDQTSRTAPEEQEIPNPRQPIQDARSNGDADYDSSYASPPDGEIIKIADIQRMNIDQLNQFGRKIGLKHLGSLTKSQMVFETVKALAENPKEILYGEGVLEILPDGFGFLRSPNYNYLPSPEDIYISPAQIRRFDLKKGDTITGPIRPPKDKEKYFALLKVDTINGTTPEKAREEFSLKT